MIDMGTFESQKNRKKEESNLEASIANKVSAQKEFNEYLLEAIDEALTSLGVPVKNTVYFQLENKFNIPKNEIPNKIDKFSEIIHRIFGLGACRLEIKFMKNLHSKINVNVELKDYEWPLSKWIINDVSFNEYVCNARENYCKNKKNSGRADPA